MVQGRWLNPFQKLRAQADSAKPIPGSSKLNCDGEHRQAFKADLEKSLHNEADGTVREAVNR